MQTTVPSSSSDKSQRQDEVAKLPWQPPVLTVMLLRDAETGPNASEDGFFGS